MLNNETIPSQTISCEASFDSNDIITESEDVISSIDFDKGILEISRFFPPRTIPSSIRSFTFTKIVSGIIDQIPGFVMCKSPER